MSEKLASHAAHGTPGMVIVAILILVVFGAKNLPAFGRSLRRSMGEFWRAKEDFEHELRRLVANHSRDEDDLPSDDGLEAAERLHHKTFRPRFVWRGRNGIVVLLMIVSGLLLIFAWLR
ncbi:MAG: twin-arginine translocase TatA/TatE family subunit [Verrucomicrobiaceae bacterium]|nr:twin-arginine translocase TatA/TatE family subunit [Verrucomicrobiaceae bacterium]